MKRYWFYIIGVVLIVSCNNYTLENKNFKALEIPDTGMIIDYDIDQVHEAVLKQKLDDIWSLQSIRSIYTDFNIDKDIDKQQIILEDSIHSVKIIEYIKPFVQGTFKLKTEIIYYNSKKDTITSVISMKEVLVDQETLKSFEISFEE